MRPLLALLLAVLPPSALAAAAAPASPAAVVERFHGVLFEHLQQGPALTCRARVQRLEPVVAATFDTPFLARFILKKHWPQLDESQRQRFTRALQTLIVRSYATNFREGHGETFETVATEGGGAQRTVRSRLSRPAADAVSFDYAMRESSGQWRVINVVADGVSDLALRTAQYDKLFAEQGFDALVKWVENQAHEDGC